MFTGDVLTAIKQWFSIAFDNKLITIPIALDTTKAFDKACLESVLTQTLGLWYLWKFLQNYQALLIEYVLGRSSFSEANDIHTAIYKFSLLNPVLFLLYINDLSGIILTSLEQIIPNVLFSLQIDYQRLADDLSSDLALFLSQKL